MASLKCSNCGFGIHYHDEPNGTEYEAYSVEMWDNLAKTAAPIVSYTDESKDFLFAWRCSECGCVHAMNGETWRVVRAYIPSDEVSSLESARKYLVFVDGLRDKVFDEEWSAEQFMQSGKYPNDQFFYAMIGDNGVIVYEDAECSAPLRRIRLSRRLWRIKTSFDTFLTSGRNTKRAAQFYREGVARVARRKTVVKPLASSCGRRKAKPSVCAKRADAKSVPFPMPARIRSTNITRRLLDGHSVAKRFARRLKSAAFPRLWGGGDAGKARAINSQAEIDALWLIVTPRRAVNGSVIGIQRASVGTQKGLTSKSANSFLR